MAGAVLGLAAGLFLQSKKGKELTKDARKKAIKLEAKVMKKLSEMGEMTKEKYEEVVDQLVEHYGKTKELAQKELPEVRKWLLSRWKSIAPYLETKEDEES